MSRAGGLVVGIGASAGGVEAFKTFLSAMPADTGMTFILVQHLDPDHPSALAEIVATCTAMEVTTIENGMAIGPDRVFVTPPDAVIKLAGGVFDLSRPKDALARRTSINTFLTSLAEDQGDNAVGVILSGFGTDGAQGVEAIKEHGGLTLAQAEIDHAPKLGMPQSAAAGGSVDHVLPIESMPGCLLDHARFLDRTDGAKGADGIRADVADHLGAISAVLNSRLGRDFSQYKTNTIMRRVQRRMQVLKIDTVSAYIEALREGLDEPELLFREVLIRVTRFFRDPAAFAALAETAIPALLAKNDEQDAIRVWVPGCATGEEAYSLAILFKEAMAMAERPRRVQIFATDVDDQAIALARTGLYPNTIAADVSSARLDRYFQKDGDHYRVSKDLREMCLFSVHDLVKDPPFSRLDMISCRNLMIYFAAPLQKRVVQMFHYGLKPGGTVLLGASEALTAHSRLFAPIDKKHRLFRRLAGPTQVGAASAPRPVPAAARAPAGEAKQDVNASVARILGQFTPAYVIIDGHQDVQQFFGPIAKYLEPATGPASFNLSRLVHTSLRAPLRATLKKVQATRTRAVERDLEFQFEGRTEGVTLVAEPLRPQDGDAGLVLVAFQELPARPPVFEARGTDEAAGDLAVSHEQLQTITEELETANEELQSSNEEYQSVNEELQSANEELETSKEELQSVNEELHTVNAELSTRNESLTDLNSDLANLIDSTAIATLFLDRDMRIKRFTPAILDLFNVREGDEGRPITDIVSHLARDGLERDVQQVMRTLVPVQREVGLMASDSAYQMHVRPYRDINDVINGVVITFVDVSVRKQAEADRAVLAAIVESSGDAIVSTDLEDTITSWNPAAERMFGFTAAEAVGEALLSLTPPLRPDEGVDPLERVRRAERIENFETTYRHKDGTAVELALTVSPVKADTGTIIGTSRLIRDITDRKRIDSALRESETRYRNLFEAIDQGFCIMEKVESKPGEPIDFRYLVTNPAFAANTGVERVDGKTMREVFPGESEDWFDIYDSIVETGTPIRFAHALESRGRELDVYAFRVEDRSKRTLAVLFADITEREQAKRQAALMLGELDHRVKNILAIVSSVINQTLTSAESPEAFAESIQGRIKAIAAAHNLLTRDGLETTLAAIVETELAPYAQGGDRITVAGEDVRLGPKAALALSMAIHELATNALKFGALSSDEGKLSIAWRVNGEADTPELRIDWTESGGPRVEPPTRRGFGFNVIERALEYEFDAEVSRAFDPTGLVCRIVMPFTEEVGHWRAREAGRNE